MPMLYLLCGLPGSGKTTRAKEIERQAAALRLTPDEWISALFTKLDQGTLDAYRTPIESLQWTVASRALALGVSVVLDWGFWGREERDAMRLQAQALGARVKIVFLDVPLEELLRRLTERNADLPPHTFRVEEAQLRRWWSWFEPPGTDELDE